MEGARAGGGAVEEEDSRFGRRCRRDSNIMIVHIVEGTVLPTRQVENRRGHWEQHEGEKYRHISSFQHIYAYPQIPNRALSSVLLSFEDVNQISL